MMHKLIKRTYKRIGDESEPFSTPGPDWVTPQAADVDWTEDSVIVTWMIHA